MISRANTDELIEANFFNEFQTSQCLLDLDYTMQVPTHHVLHDCLRRCYRVTAGKLSCFIGRSFRNISARHDSYVLTVYLWYTIESN